MFNGFVSNSAAKEKRKNLATMNRNKELLILCLKEKHLNEIHV
jgi:hypothetical protein